MRSTNIYKLIILGAILAGCRNGKGSEIKVSSPDIYFDYQLRGSEEEDYISCLLKYRLKGPEGAGTRIQKPGKVLIDGELINPDSSSLTGIYYEKIKSQLEFSGTHSIELIDKDLNSYVEKFDFAPLTLDEELPAKINRHPFIIKLKDFPEQGSLRVVLIDTSFKSKMINEVVDVKNGTIGINQFMLDQLKNGPIILKLYLEQEIPISKSLPPGGLLRIVFSLEREFSLSN